MEEKLIQNAMAFSGDPIDEVYSRCYFQLVEERTALIYHSPHDDMYLKISVESEEDSSMYVTDIATGESVLLSAASGTVTCDDDRMPDDAAQEVVQRYLALMEGFVNFAGSEE